MRVYTYSITAILILISPCIAQQRSDVPSAVAKSEAVAREKPAAYYARGNEWFTKGDFQSAIDCYSQVIALDQPNCKMALVRRGDAYTELGDLGSAIQDYNRAIKLDPTFALAFACRGRAFRDQNDLTRAIDDYTKAIDLAPMISCTYINRGECFALKEDPDKAKADFAKAIEIGRNPLFSENDWNGPYKYPGTQTSCWCPYMAYAERCLVFIQERNYDAALMDADKAIAKQDFPYGYYVRGSVFAWKKDYSAAIVNLNKAINLDKDYIQAYKARAEMLQLTGKSDLAEADQQMVEKLKAEAAKRFKRKEVKLKPLPSTR
jgi:tetratricopeptide (TPR) repeat protein